MIGENEKSLQPQAGEMMSIILTSLIFFIKHTLKIEDTTLNYINVTAKGTFNKHSVGYCHSMVSLLFCSI